MITNGIIPEQPLSSRELFAGMIMFLLPLISLAEAIGISLPQWTNLPRLIFFWGCILFALGLAIAKRLPGWSFPYLGFLLMLGVIVSPLWKLAEWIFPSFINTFGAQAYWPIPIGILYGVIFEFVFATTLFVGALFLVHLLRLLPYTRAVWRRIRVDWTWLSFMLYGGLVFYIMLAFEDYRQAELWKLAAWGCLAAGAWLYLRRKEGRSHIRALLGGTTGAFWIVAIAKWMLIPLQDWVIGDPTVPANAGRWIEVGQILTSWLFILGILSAPALLKWLPPLPGPGYGEEEEPANA